MSLFKSLLTTALIFVTVWGLLIWKNAALIDEQKNLAENNASTGSQSHDNANSLAGDPTQSNASITLIGIQKTIRLGSMSEINRHWQNFYGLNELHGAIPSHVSGKVYGYYRALDDSFDNAELTIGYNSRGVSVDTFNVLQTLDFNQFEPVMENSKSWDTTPAWNSIDTNRAVVAVLEEYVMGIGGNVTSTNVYVHYE